MLVGRTDELRRLGDRVSEAADGNGGAIVVEGEPGAGVTSLLAAVARRAPSTLRVVRARAYAGSAPGALLHDLAREVDADAGSWESVVDAVHASSASAPLLLVVDDADRADPESVARLAEVVARAPGVLAVVGWQVRGGTVHEALHSWDRMMLGPLDLEASLAVSRAALGHDTPALPALVVRLHGNPLALRDVPPRLASEVLAGRAPLPADLPVPEALVDAWSAVLPEPGSDLAVALLQAALCTPAPPAAGPRALPTAATRLLADCPLVTVASDRVTWSNPWLREVALARADEGARRRAHAALAARAGAVLLAPSVVAHHLVGAAPGLDDTVADALEEQARRAQEMGLPDVVPTTWAAAALRTADPRRRLERAVAGARALTATGPGMNGVDALLDVLDRAELDPEATEVRDRLRALERTALDPDARVAALGASVEQARASSSAALPDLLWELSVLAGQHGDVAVGVAAAQEYRDLEAAGVTVGKPVWTGGALLSAALFQAGEIAAAERLRHEVHLAAAVLVPSTADLDELFNAVALDDLVLDLSPQASERLLHLVQRLQGEAYPVACLYGIQGWRARARGDLATARRMLGLGLEVAVSVSAIDVVCGLRALGAELSAIQGDGALDRDEADLRALLQSAGDRRRLSTLDRALGLRALVDRRIDEAVVHLTAACDTPMLGRGLRDGVVMGRADLVEACLRADDPSAALRHASTVLDVLDRMDEPLAAALALRVRALVETPEDGVRLLGDALVAHSAALDPFEHARTFLLRGERLRRLRRRSEARLDLLEAARRFRQLEAEPWCERAEAELRACGGNGSSHRGPATASALTGQELAVAAAVARGASNREVADELFLSPRTVEYHLSNVYRKLGVHGRSALASMLSASGDVDLTGPPDAVRVSLGKG